MGTHHRYQHSHSDHGRSNHISGVEMASITKNSHYSSKEGGSCTSRSSHPTGCKARKPSYSNVATQLRCSPLKESHTLFRCDKFLNMQVQQSLNHVNHSRLCYNCLQPFPRNHTCSKGAIIKLYCNIM